MFCRFVDIHAMLAGRIDLLLALIDHAGLGAQSFVCWYFLCHGILHFLIHQPAGAGLRSAIGPRDRHCGTTLRRLCFFGHETVSFTPLPRVVPVTCPIPPDGQGRAHGHKGCLDATARRALFLAAASEDCGASHIKASILVLASAGLLDWDMRGPDALFGHLIAIGEVNLPAARLFEGHVNALRLIRAYADPSLQADVRRDVKDGLLLGVWGADGHRPLEIVGPGLTGGKKFASGLGVVGKAIVTVGQGSDLRLALLDVSDTARHIHASWRKTGMRATVSGDFDATDLPSAALQWVGAPGQYFNEPLFIGGVWRIAAVQAGGALGLLRAAADNLASLGRLTHEAQVARLAPVLTRALAAAEFTRQAAICAEGPQGLLDPDCAASLSAQARLLTEDVGQDVIAAVERSIGLSHFDVDAVTGRIARDLATYMRQAARDAFLQRAGSWALGQNVAFSTLLGGGGSDARM